MTNITYDQTRHSNVARRDSGIARFIAAVLLLLSTTFLASRPSEAHLVDNFDRADSVTLGNGWIEKSANAFSIVDNRVAKQAVSSWYRDNIAYRPASEDVLDVETSLEFRILASPPGYPQLFARLQSATAATTDVLDGYILFFENTSSQAVLGRQSGTNYPTILATLNLSQALNTGDTYRMRLSVTGTSPVILDAYIERLSGGVWQVIGQASYADASAQRYATAGSVGFSGYIENSYTYDNFTRTDLGAVGTTNPVPALTSLAPASAQAGESDLILVAYGSGFTTDSIVRWNGSSRSTTYVSPSEIEALISTSDLATAGTAQVTVVNPAPGGGQSAAQAFQIAAPQTLPVPGVTTLIPAGATAGDAAFTLTVNGSNFDSSTVVRWNGTARTTNFVSGTQLQASITAADLANAGSANVTVYRASDATSSGNASSFVISPAPTSADFVDAFTRADSATLGNGWIEKSANAFAIVGNRVAKQSVSTWYRDNVVYRPASEDVLDVETSLEFRILASPPGYPQLFARLQSATAATTDVLDGYILFFENTSNQAVIGRQSGTSYPTILASLNLSQALNTSDTYRMRLSATGTSPVVLDAYIERLSAGVWQVIGQTSYTDASAQRYATAGSVGFSGYIENSYTYDNFTRTDLNPSSPNPLPATSNLSPASATAGSSAMQLDISGNNFVSGSIVRWNGSDRTTTYVSDTLLQAQITSADLATAGNAIVTVFSPAPGGGASNGQTFVIDAPASNPAPVATTLTPSGTAAGSNTFTLTVQGTGFVNGSVVRWNGANRTTIYVSGTELRAAISAADVSSSGTAAVSVVSPAPGGGTSGSLTFTISAANNPTPATSSLSPASIAAGAGSFSLTINGSGFIDGSTVRWNGSARSTTFVSSSQLAATITAADVSTAGTASITVVTPAPGGGTSNAQTFSITDAPQGNPIPVLNQLSPIAAAPGGSTFNLTVTGTGFTQASTVRWNGADRTTTYISSTELRASIPGADIASAGLGTVTVATPAPGGGTSVPLTFFIQDNSIDFFFDGFNRSNTVVVGNNWTEKNPDAFSIQNNELVSSITPYLDFRENIMYRPVGEDRLNVETSVEFTRLPNGSSLATANFPQVHARVQQNTVTEGNTLDSYIFFIEDLSPARAMIAASRSSFPGQFWECYIAPVPLLETPAVGERYRLTLRVTGTSPVQLNGRVERFVNGSWQSIGFGQTIHDASTQRDPSLFCDDAQTMPPPITTPGSVGVAKWTNRTDNYDNFYWREIDGVSNPPMMSVLAPQSIQAGASSLELTINGSGFTPDSVVRWNGMDRGTTYVSANELRAAIPASDVVNAGTAYISVFDAGQTSSSLLFEIYVDPVEILFDDFNRADNTDIENNWIEKTASSFLLAGGGAQKLVTPGGDYRNNVVYRPASENMLNSGASVEFRLQSGPIGYPFVFVRGLASTIAIPGQLDAYLLYINNNATSASLVRQRGSGYDVLLSGLSLSQSLNTSDTYRLRLSAVGVSPVRLTAYVERFNGSNWEILGQAVYNDTSAERINAAGTVGFGGDTEDAHLFDNFRSLFLGN